MTDLFCQSQTKYPISIYWNLTKLPLPRSKNKSYSGIFDLTMVEYTTYRYIRPYHGRINHLSVYWTLPWSNIPHTGILDLTMVEYTTYWYIGPYHGRISHIPVYSTMTNFFYPGRIIYHIPVYR